MLDAHPDLAIPSPTFFVPTVLKIGEDLPDAYDRFIDVIVSSETWRDHHISSAALRKQQRTLFAPGIALRSFYTLYAARFGKRRWGDSTHRYGHCIAEILQQLPEAHFIHVIRDGRDAAVLAQLSHGWKGFGSIENHAKEWRYRVPTFCHDGAECSQYMEIRYEHLITYTPRVLWKICEFLRLPFSATMLAYHKNASRRIEDLQDLNRPYGNVSRAERLLGTYSGIIEKSPDIRQIGRWRREMKVADIVTYQQIAGDLLSGLGYPIWQRPMSP